MKIVTQNLNNGDTKLADIPCPVPNKSEVFIRSKRTLVSVGTERMLVEFGKANIFKKAASQPDKVKLVLQKLKTDGVQATIESVLNKLDLPLPLGYCNVGRVVEQQEASTKYNAGDRVVSNGYHAEFVTVPVNLTAKIPDAVSDDEAAFTVLSSVALQGVRLAEPTIGERFVVYGLGLVGLLTVQLLRANGCQVLGLDFNKERLALARRFGAEVQDLSQIDDPLPAATTFSNGRGVDGVILTLSTTSNEPVSHAAQMCRKLGRVILVGVSGLNLSRDDFFKKEIRFQVSASYGPGRYDPLYENEGQDYPFGYVRWTEQRNFEAVLDLMASGALDVKPFISHRFNLEESEQAYKLLFSDVPSLGILLDYSENEESLKRVVSLQDDNHVAIQNGEHKPTGIAFIGAGQYAKSKLIPCFKKQHANLETIVSKGGLSSWHAGNKFGFKKASTDIEAALEDNTIRDVVITTRHNNHADLVLKSLKARKNIFVEKPLCLTISELEEIKALYTSMGSTRPLLMVGFNRRFSSLVQDIKKNIAATSDSKTMIMTVNAGSIPADHWTQDPKIGGGRLIGEACHFIDLLKFLAGSDVSHYQVHKMGDKIGDSVTITLSFSCGSIGTIHYFANGHKSVPKERLEIFCSGKIIQLDNFTKMKAYGFPKIKNRRLLKQDKGQMECVKTFLQVAETGGDAPIPFSELYEVHKIAIELQNQ